MELFHCPQRQRDLLNLLLMTDEWISGRELSNKLNVSDRTIRKDIIELNDILNQYDSAILSERGKGYLLKSENRKYLLSTLNNNNRPDEKKNRIFEIIMMLAFFPDGVDLYDIEDELFISRTTLEKELKNIQAILSERYPALRLQRIKGLIRLDGSERFLRLFFNYVLMESYDPQTREITAYSQRIDKHHLEHIKHIVLDITISFHITLSDRDLMDLVSHLFILELRIKQQKYIESRGTARNGKNYKYLDQISKQILSELIDLGHCPESYFHLELKQLSVKLSFINYKTDVPPTNIMPDEIIPDQILHVANRLITQINEEFSIDLSKDDELFSGLVFHIKTLLNCYKYNQQPLNPLIDIIKKDYPFVFELSLSIYNIFYDELDIRLTESELGYIATHIGASIERTNQEYGKNNVKIAITTNVPVSYTKLFASKIKSICGDRGKIIGTFPSYKLKEVLQLQPDLIISTCSIEYDTKIPILPIGLSITKHEKVVLENAFEQLQKKWMYKRQSQNWIFIEKFRKELFDMNYEARSAEDVMYHMSQKMEKMGYVFDDFYDGLLERENLSSSVLANGIAIPHPLNAIALVSVIGVTILKKPILWRNSGHKVQLVFVIAIRKSEKQEIRNFFNFISKLIEDNQKVRAILQCKNFEEFISNVQKITI